MKLLRIKETLFLIGTAFLFLLSGCSQTWQITEKVQPKEKNKLTFKLAQERLHGKEVKVLLRDKRQFNGIITEIASDSVHLQNDADTTERVFPTSQIKCIERTDYFAGGVLGCIGGTAGGLLLGAAISEAVIPPGGDMRGLGVMMVMVETGTIGFLGGTIYGAISGRDSYYEFADTTATTVPGPDSSSVPARVTQP
ncbi:MAG: hypothetical protein HUU54_07310 [Ignavibacteriaceae bacterium]|nr:hypothetical protein [Ignavibacteriaceae bacterium]